MTKIRFRVNPVWHETNAAVAAPGGQRQLLVSENPYGLHLRLKGTRQKLFIPWATAYLHAARIEAEKVRQAKVTARKERAKSRARR